MLREKKGVSQQFLANKLGISQQSINKYENHNIEPDITTMIAMADYFDVTLDYLVGRENNDVKIESRELTKREIEVLKSYSELSDTEKICIDVVMKTYNDLKLK